MERQAGEAGILYFGGSEGELVDGMTNFGLGHRLGLGEAESRIAHNVDLDIRAGERRGIDGAADLTSAVAELSPEVCAPRRSGFGKSGELSAATVIVDDDFVGRLQMPAVD